MSSSSFPSPGLTSQSKRRPSFSDLDDKDFEHQILTKIFDDGTFVGTLSKEGLRAGKIGKMNYNNGETFFGEWVKDKIFSGIYTWPADNRVYIGSFKDDEMNGEGRLYSSEPTNLFECEGFFVDGELHGEGKMTGLFFFSF